MTSHAELLFLFTHFKSFIGFPKAFLFWEGWLQTLVITSGIPNLNSKNLDNLILSYPFNIFMA